MTASFEIIPIHCSPFTLTFNATCSKLLTAS